MPTIRTVPAEVADDVARATAAHGTRAESLLPILRELDRRRNGLDAEVVGEIARRLALPAVRVEGVARFYSLLGRDRSRRREIRLCGGIVCRLAGSETCRAALDVAASADAWTVAESSCLGLCDRAPATYVDGMQIGPLSASSALGTIESASVGKPPSAPTRATCEHRLLLRDAGRIDPSSIDDAIAGGAYGGLETALLGPPDVVLMEIERSRLSGRGGAGFPTGRKWRIVADSPDPVRYVVCNADESEPLMFKDRYLLESDPHLVVEGMALAAYAVGAAEGIVYVRGEYEPQARLLEHAIAEARNRGWLGDGIHGTDFSFRIHVHRGAGAYVCGEESALIASLEGRRGEPTLRPPYPTQSGLHGRPTVVNNVETFAAAAAICRGGADAFLRLGSSERPGTRLYTVLGHVGEPGLVEATQEHTLGEMIDRFGGGLREGSEFGFALTGGAAGTFVGPEGLDSRFDDPSDAQFVTAGAGGIFVCDTTVSPVEMLREVLRFFEVESCGKCTPCRIGTSVARETLDELLAGRGSRVHVDRLGQLAASLHANSFCGLGRFAALPLSTALERFPDRFDELVP